MEKINQYLINQYDLSNFIIYPISGTNNSDMIGKINIDTNTWNNVNSKLEKSKYIEKKLKSYVYRDLEMIHDLELDEHCIIHKSITHTANIDNKFLLIIYSEKNIDYDSFPKLNSYHSETNKKKKIYKFGSVILSLISEEENNETINYIELSFLFKEKNLAAITKDLTFVLNILKLN